MRELTASEILAVAAGEGSQCWWDIAEQIAGAGGTAGTISGSGAYAYFYSQAQQQAATFGQLFDSAAAHRFATVQAGRFLAGGAALGASFTAGYQIGTWIYEENATTILDAIETSASATEALFSELSLATMDLFSAGNDEGGFAAGDSFLNHRG